MISGSSLILRFAIGGWLCLGGCGLVYDAGARVKTYRMEDSLKQGENSLEVHQHWGEPDLRQDANPNTQIWSYAIRPNSNDITATLLYTSTKPGDKSKFLDLKFIDGKLVSWNEAEHTVPAKEGAGMTYGFGPGGGASRVSHY